MNERFERAEYMLSGSRTRRFAVGGHLALCLVGVALLCAGALAQEKAAQDWAIEGEKLLGNGSVEGAVLAFDESSQAYDKKTQSNPELMLRCTSMDNDALEIKSLIAALGETNLERKLDAAYKLRNITANQSLSKISDKKEIDILIQALSDNNSSIRSLAAILLGDIRNTRAVVPLIQALNDTDSATRVNAAWSLGWIGDTRAIDPLVGVLKEDDDRYVRNNAAFAISAIVYQRAINPLNESSINDVDPMVRDAASLSVKRLQYNLDEFFWPSNQT